MSRPVFNGTKNFEIRNRRPINSLIQAIGIRRHKCVAQCMHCFPTECFCLTASARLVLRVIADRLENGIITETLTVLQNKVYSWFEIHFIRRKVLHRTDIVNNDLAKKALYNRY